MRQAFRLSCAVAVALALAGCSVQVHNTTPSHFQANPHIGMYPITATITSGTLVSSPIYLYEMDGHHKLRLHADATGTVWHAMLPVRCQSSFPLQYLAVWQVQGISTRQKLFPPQPLEVKLEPPPLTKEAVIDTSGAPVRGAWQGAVNYEFATAANTNITAAKIEPIGKARQDLLWAKAIHIVSTFPIAASCDTPTAVMLSSGDRVAKAKLVISIQSKTMPTWTTTVSFRPKPAGV
jgi:hypothetical protein